MAYVIDMAYVVDMAYVIGMDYVIDMDYMIDMAYVIDMDRYICSPLTSIDLRSTLPTSDLEFISPHRELCDLIGRGGTEFSDNAVGGGVGGYLDSDDDEDDGFDDVEIPLDHPMSDYNITIKALPSGTISDLHEIAKRMVIAGYRKECSLVYSTCRREFLKESLSRLGFLGLQNSTSDAFANDILKSSDAAVEVLEASNATEKYTGAKSENRVILDDDEVGGLNLNLGGQVYPIIEDDLEIWEGKSGRRRFWDEIWGSQFVYPNYKRRFLVKVLRKSILATQTTGGHVVAVTGDGTNDAPTLHEVRKYLNFSIVQDSNIEVESGEWMYFPALNVGVDKPSTLSFWMDGQTSNLLLRL
ncbi:unnamed protein product [Lactuca saligna]|uniref:Uncharacterized protein n=1 Tax=Lactuca saligna TaxID=75948 RepID=A0AA36DXY2_LACSI|nr:unnamed protein product [Lactuca saligna]